MADGLQAPPRSPSVRATSTSFSTPFLSSPPSLTLPSLSPTSTGCGSAAIHLASSLLSARGHDMHRRSVRAARPLHRPVHAVSTHTLARSPAELHPLPFLRSTLSFRRCCTLLFQLQRRRSRSLSPSSYAGVAGWLERASERAWLQCECTPG